MFAQKLIEVMFDHHFCNSSNMLEITNQNFDKCFFKFLMILKELQFLKVLKKVAPFPQVACSFLIKAGYQSKKSM
jgi:hypothetical protein